MSYVAVSMARRYGEEWAVSVPVVHELLTPRRAKAFAAEVMDVAIAAEVRNRKEADEH